VTKEFARPERVTASLQTLGESPVWSVREQALYWVDLRAPALHSYDPASGAERRWTMPELIGGVVLAEEGKLVVALRTGLHAFDPATGTLSPLLRIEPESANNRLNETKCDRRGRLWTSSMRDFGAATTGSLYRVDADLTATRLLGDITIPNGICWSPDGATLYFADTADERIRGYDFDAVTGTLGAMRIVVERGVLPGRPDGATVDADGCLWSARYGGGAVVRIDPRGRADRVLRLPVSQVSSCAFGGSDLATLFVTTSRQRMSPAQLAVEPHAGALFAVDVGVAGLPELSFTTAPTASR
jgi:sugar lactone lactonase YvrE